MVASAGRMALWDPAFFAAMDRLLKPRSFAVIGASPNPSFVSGIFNNAIGHDFAGSIYAINPNYREVSGRPCYPSLREVPEPVDHVVVGVPVRLLPQVLADAEAAGARSLNIVSSGFAELASEEGQQRQRELGAWSRRTGIRVVGPNCLGLISNVGRLVALPGWYSDRTGPLAVVLQSGQMASSIATPLSDRGVGFSYIVSSGNEADLEAADFMRYFVEEESVRVIGAYVEQFRTAEKLIEVAELAAERRKPIVVLKIGRSEPARQAARAHTGALVGSDRVLDAVFRQHGVHRVESVDEMFEAMAIFLSPRLPRGDGVAAIFVSGGAVGLSCDLAPACGLRFPRLEESTMERLRACIPEYGTAGNPLDITGQGVFDAPIVEGSIAALAEDPNVDTILWGRGFPSRLDRQVVAGRVLTESVDRYPEKVFLVFSLTGGTFFPQTSPAVPLKEPICELGGVPFLQGTEYAYKAVAALNRYAAFQRRRAGRGAAGRATPAATGERARALLAGLFAGGATVLTEREGKQLLALYGIPVTHEALASTRGGAIAAGQQLGFPVVMKVESRQIAHKTEARAVRVGVADAAAAGAAFDEIVASARAYAPGAEIRGVLVQQMVEDGVETILGMSHDPDYGPCVAFGLGGILVEALDDVSLRVPPLDRDEAQSMVDGLRAGKILSGLRGAPPADVGAAVDAILRFADLVQDVGDLVGEIDVNPLMVLPEGAVAVDCLVVGRSG
ncbi:MAG TPA: acetate--CoA ligase family protein [Chloroflexota bacterium]|jgi:acetyltransferase